MSELEAQGEQAERLLAQPYVSWRDLDAAAEQRALEAVAARQAAARKHAEVDKLNAAGRRRSAVRTLAEARALEAEAAELEAGR